MTSSTFLHELSSAVLPIGDMAAAIRTLHAIRQHAMEMQQRLGAQQLDEPNHQIDLQLEYLSSFYRSVAENTQTASDAAMRALGNLKNAARELEDRRLQVEALEQDLGTSS